jgi:perosamine synthetase
MTKSGNDMHKMIAGAQPCFPAEDRAALLADIDAALTEGALAHGRHVAAFEAACAEMAGVRHALAVSSGAAALQLAWEAVDVRGAEVVVPTETFAATATTVLRAGGAPVFADVDPRTLSPSPAMLEAALTPRVKAVALVHMFGLMSPDLPALRALCRDRGLIVVEDAAHAHGGEIDGMKAGGIGALGCFSYYATKILTTGEGGVVTTDDDRLAARVAALRNHGRAPGEAEITSPGGNYRLGEIPALLGVAQQRRLPEFLAHRRRIAAIYRAAFTGARALTPIDPAPYDGHAYWRYAVLPAPGVDREALQRRMADDHGVRLTWMYEPLCHRQPLFAAAARPLPGAESVCGRLINLPTHPGVSETDAARVADGLRRLSEEIG